MTIPNILSSIRLLLSPLLLVIAWYGLANIFIGILIFAFFLDLIDGPLARQLNQVSELGPKIDSWADFSIYLSFLIGALWLWPDIIRREWVFILILGLSIVMPAVIGLIKFHKPTSYHTWLVKLSAVCMAPSSIILFLHGPAWPFHIATYICLMSAIEEIMITFLVKEPVSDVHSIVHILRNRRNSA